MSIDKDTFLRECKRRFGAMNPERMRLAYWEWMVRRGGGPFSVRQDLGLPHNPLVCSGDTCTEPDPDWCFERFGPTRTKMPDGRIICIGGEHEDWYDPDFCIYNDLIVLRPVPGQDHVTLDSGEVEIYGYPESVFPPTDFHSATLVGDEIYVIGSLGYPADRRAGTTPVFCFDTRSYQVNPIATTGPCPGWIYKHHAFYDAATHSITIRGGKLLGTEVDVDSGAVHRLCLTTRAWTCVTENDTFHAYKFSTSSHVEYPDYPPISEFRPKTVAHQKIFTASAYDYFLEICGIRVRFKDEYTSVIAIIEGTIPTEPLLAFLLELADYLGPGPHKWTFEDADPNNYRE